MGLGDVEAARRRAPATPLTFLGLHPLHHSKLWYFLSFGAFACITPFLPLFYRQWGGGPGGSGGPGGLGFRV